MYCCLAVLLLLCARMIYTTFHMCYQHLASNGRCVWCVCVSVCLCVCVSVLLWRCSSRVSYVLLYTYPLVLPTLLCSLPSCAPYPLVLPTLLCSLPSLVLFLFRARHLCSQGSTKWVLAIATSVLILLIDPAILPPATTSNFTPSCMMP
jgi:hypothetical protein